MYIKKPNIVVAIIIIIANLVSTVSIVDLIFPRTSIQDAPLNFTELAEKYGHKCEEYKITTLDGYILTVFNIVGNRDRPVFLVHGCLDSADTYIVRGKGSLAITLADAGYDVWLGNLRGNKYSRHHLTLNPDTDKVYWDFSFHEIGFYDLPATIDFILSRTGTEQLQAIGYSQGTTAFYVLTSKRPEYNEKIQVLISLAPIAFMRNVEGPVLRLMKMEPYLSDRTEASGKVELFAIGSDESKTIHSLCRQRLSGYIACAKGFLFPITGFDEEEFEPDFFHVLLGYSPTSISRKDAKHLAMLRKQFAEYDYGSAKNLMVYNSTEPPEYDLSNISMKVALFVGKNDRLSVIKDVDILRSKLPNVVEYHIMERETFNHLDFVWGKHMHVYLFPHIFEVLQKYSYI